MRTKERRDDSEHHRHGRHPDARDQRANPRRGRLLRERSQRERRKQHQKRAGEPALGLLFRSHAFEPIRPGQRYELIAGAFHQSFSRPLQYITGEAANSSSLRKKN